MLLQAVGEEGEKKIVKHIHSRRATDSHEVELYVLYMETADGLGERSVRFDACHSQYAHHL